MQIRPIYTIGCLAVVLALCGIGWNMFRPKPLEPVKIYKAISPETSQAPQTTETAQPSKESLPSEERTDRHKDVTLDVVRTLRGTGTDPFLEKLQKAMETPEYQEYLRKQRETLGVDLSLWWNFLESQGLGSGRSLQERDFNALFPDGGNASDYEPEMRKKFAELVLENPFKDTGTLLGEFWRQDKANYIWTRQHFNGHAGDYDWAENIRQNAGSILAEFTSVDVETAHSDFISESRTTEVAEENNNTQLLPGEENETQTTPFEQVPQSLEALETELTENIFANIPKMPNNGDFEKTLREQFSPHRFNAAMQALTQYGPQEGLRRLKESDPDIATHIERLISPEKSNN